MRSQRIVLVLTGLILLLNCPLTLNGYDNAEDDRCKSRIVFSFDSSNSGMPIYIVNSDGSDPRQIVSGVSASNGEFGLAWSPDGQQIGFIKYTDVNGSQPYIVSVDGTKLYPVVDSTELNYSDFEWSPDGKWLLSFGSERGQYNVSKLHLINIENKKLIEIKVADDYQVESAAWSPDGKNIIFSSGPADGIIGQNDIYRVSFDDLLSPNQPPLEKLTDTPANDTSPSWSPRGNKIAFISNRDGDYDIYVMNADGSNLTSITSNSQDNFSLKWSPDNQWIAYRETTGEHETDLYISEVDGTKDPIKIFSHPGAYDWAPDGTEIVVSKPELFGDLYVVNAESGEARELKVNSIDNYDWPAGLDWSPCTH